MASNFLLLWQQFSTMVYPPSSLLLLVNYLSSQKSESAVLALCKSFPFACLLIHFAECERKGHIVNRANPSLVCCDHHLSRGLWEKLKITVA